MSVAGNLGRQTFPVPIGSIFLFAGSQSKPAPATYLVCDGSAFDPAKYPLLADALGGSNTPDLKQKNIGGGPIVDVGTIVPPAQGAITGSNFSLTAQNIPSIDFDFTTTATGYVDGYSSTLGTLPLLLSLIPTITADNIPGSNNSVPPADATVIPSVTVTIPDSAVYTNPSVQTEVTPSLTITSGNPTSLVFRYIIKAEY